MTTDGQPAGWFPDPQGRAALRWWDGTTWTDQVSDGTTSSIDPLVPGAPPPGPSASEGPARSGARGPVVPIAILLGVLALGVVGFLVLGGDDGGLLDESAADDRADAALEAAGDEGDQNDDDPDAVDRFAEELDEWLGCIADEAGVEAPGEAADPDPIVFRNEADVGLAVIAFEASAAAIVDAAAADDVADCVRDGSVDSDSELDVDVEAGPGPDLGDRSAALALTLDTEFGDFGLDTVLVSSGQFLVYARASISDTDDDGGDAVEERDAVLAAAVAVLAGA
ncbi:MAG: DUF2510 domain-containing protein [Acidimicrobiia bacterium]|nr:DUF2510 domain-containing protein [Acidimicrobiia bacterium]